MESSSTSWLTPKIIYHLICYSTPESLSKLTQFSLYPWMYFSDHRQHSSCLWSWCFWWPYPIQVWLLWLCQMRHSCLRYSKGQWSNWNWNYYPQVCWHQGKICLAFTSGLPFTIIQGLPFQSSSLSSELWRKEHHFWRSSWDSPDQLEPDRHSYWCFWV